MAIQSAIDKPGWKARGDFLGHGANNSSPYFPRLRHVLQMFLTFFRCFVLVVISWWRGRGVFINIFKMLKHKPYNGVPCGGIGCGGIGRDFRGGFNKYSLLPGLVEQDVEAIKANQFILSVRRSSDAKLLYQRVLTCVPHSSSPLSSWDCRFPPQEFFYTGLYPRSWTEYSIPELGLKLLCTQISPLIPHDYKNASLPVCSFVWSVESSSLEDYVVSLAFTFRNGTGNCKFEKESLCRSSVFSADSCKGVTLRHTINGFGVTYALAMKSQPEVEFSATDFDPAGNGRDIWDHLADPGNFDNARKTVSSGQLGVAVCGQFLCKREKPSSVEFALAWDMPNVRFGGGEREYTRRYTRFFTDASRRAEEICEYAVRSRSDWETQIDKWQDRVIHNHELPEWYKSALFNELYFLTDGGTCWMEFDEEWRSSELQMSDESAEHFRKFGRFAYLESWEYFMFNTFDVHFYASFALLENFPEIELSIQLDIGDQLTFSDESKRANMSVGSFTAVKKFGRIPHDLGNPNDEPWLRTNAYMLNDTGEWKDLNLKFVLASYRDLQLIVKKKDIPQEEKRKLLRRFYDLSSTIMSRAAEWDVDGDGVIENAGVPDQTFDVWCMNGTSAYCGALWLGAVECARRMAEELGETSDAAEYSRMVDSARAAYEKKLWNGRYFDFDERSEGRHNVMAGQLCGFWYLSMVDGFLDKRIANSEKVRSALEVIFELNVMKFGNGELGPVNGMTSSGDVDATCIQSEEIWGGVAYSLGAFGIMMDRPDIGFKTAEGWYRNCWERLGLQFQSPEATTSDGKYRAIGYMRPLAVWAMQRAIDLKGSAPLTRH